DEHGLGADLTPTEVVHPVLQQFQASDWDFLISRLEAAGQLCAVEAGVVRSYVPTLDDEAEADVLFGATLLELDAEVDARPQVGTVRAQAWDPAGQDLAEAEAVEPTWPGPGDLSVDELTAATERTEELLWHGGALAPDALQAWADGRLLRSRLAGARGRARFQGLATVRPGMVLGLGGLGARFDGTVHVTGVRHELSHGDWTTDAEFGLDPEPHAARFPVGHLPAAGLAPPVRGLQVGVVSQLADDPAGEHRVRVQIPTAGLDDPGLWARIATLDAGDGRGTFFRPEVGDEVALGFFHDDPTQPVVLGMLHSSAKAPPLDAAEDNPQKAYVSREGLTLLFDDAEGILRLETPGGNRLTLSDADGGLTLEDQNGNRLEMGSDGIVLHSAKSLGLSAETDLAASGLEVNLEASTGFSAKGGATAEVTSDGPLTLQGAVVQIN
ncbi:MAG: type VI secretion system tip protein VgrG, partial [Acidobacteriota bacterium]